MATKRPSISAFFPAYNDGGTIGSLVVTTLNTLAELTDDYEVLVVENGSTDYTVEVLEDLARKYDRSRFLAHREALGYGGALRVGFKECAKDLACWAKKLDDTDAGVRERAAYELGRGGDAKYIDVLVKRLSDENLETRAAAITAADWLISDSPEAFKAAKASLEKIEKQLADEAGKTTYVKVNEDLRRLAVKLGRDA